MKKGTSVFANGLLWFGAAVSIAEILTGTMLTSLGFRQGLLAIVLGHLIGGVLFYLAGMIGARTSKAAMETVKISFGQKGMIFFSSLNVLQLLGWAAVMIVVGTEAANSIYVLKTHWNWGFVIVALSIIWLVVGHKKLEVINFISMLLLFSLTIVLSVTIFGESIHSAISGHLTFGQAVELSAAMPLSWLPLISDYTSKSEKKRATTLTSTIVYFFTSCWMYIIGLGAALFVGESDIAVIMKNAGLGIAGLLIVIFSTVTSEYVTIYSAGRSSESIYPKLKTKYAGIAICLIGLLLAIFTPITKFEHFLYFIGSVFTPMATILITDFFILKTDHSDKNVYWKNFILWLIGFAIYRLFMRIDTPVGISLPVIVIISIICVLVHLAEKKIKNMRAA